MYSRRNLGLAMACLLLAGQARAENAALPNLARMTPGYNYFNRPGSDMASHDRDIAACTIDASKLQSVDQQLGGGSGLGIVGALIGGALADAANNGVMAASIENCMVAHGWRVVVLPDAEGMALAALEPGDLRKRLSPWIEGNAPNRVIARTWRNEALDGSINHFSIRPPSPKGRQLSVKAIETANLPESKSTEENKPKPKIKLDPKWPKKILEPADFAMGPPGSAILIVNIKGMSMRNGNGFLIRRDGPDMTTPASAIDQATDSFFALRGGLGKSKESRFLAVAVPPGRWRFAASISGMQQLNYCLGAPSFELKAGEVLFLGTFDLGASRMGPDMSMAEVNGWLAAAPAAAAIVKPAVYLNGSRGACEGNAIYALEFDGVPFAPDYKLGSASSVLATADR